MVRGLRVVAAAAAIASFVAGCASTPPVPVSASITRGDTPRLVTPDKPLQCVSYVRAHSKFAIRGDAYTWWDQARGHYEQDGEPRVGAVMVLTGYAGPKHGHVALVRRIVSSREIRVDHANWLNDGAVYLNTPVIDVSPDNDWSQVRVWNTRDGHLGGGTYNVQGFIYPERAAS